MASWGPGSFDNDDAVDWVTALMETDDPSFLDDAFAGVLEDSAGYLEASDCAVALAAVEVVAALNARATADLPDEVRRWVSEHLGGARPKLVTQARRAIAAVLAGSETKDVWEDTDDRERWRQGVDDLVRRLG